MNQIVPQLQQQSNSYDTCISNKMGPLHIIQECSESILMKHFLGNGLAEEIQLIGQHVHLT